MKSNLNRSASGAKRFFTQLWWWQPCTCPKNINKRPNRLGIMSPRFIVGHACSECCELVKDYSKKEVGSVL